MEKSKRLPTKGKPSESIRSIKKFRERTLDFRAFDGCFDGNNGMTDIDGIKERNGYLLILEKKQPGAEVPTGQRRLLECLSLKSQTTVIVFWGDEYSPERVELWRGKKRIRLNNIFLTIQFWYFASCRGKEAKIG